MGATGVQVQELLAGLQSFCSMRMSVYLLQGQHTLALSSYLFTAFNFNNDAIQRVSNCLAGAAVSIPRLN